MYIRQVTAYTTDFDAQRAFYTGTLGFPLLREATDSFTLGAGAAKLTFQRAPAGDTPHIQHIAFNIPPHQFEQALDWTEARVSLLRHEGKRFVDFSRTTWRARSVYFEDAAGNVLEFIARERTPAPDAPAQFSAASVLTIGEIGLAAAHPPALTMPLRQELGLPVFDGDPHGTFCALGDDNGLLLVVEQGRAWLPTENRTAVVKPVAVKVAGDHPSTLEQAPYTVEVVSS